MEKLKKKKLSNKWLLAFLAIFMFIGSVMFSFTTIGYAYTDDNNFSEWITTSGFSLSSTGSATWKFNSASELEGEVDGSTDISGCDSDANGTFTFKYTGDYIASLSFAYKITSNGGNCTIDGTRYTGEDSFSKASMSKNSTVVIKITSGKGSSHATKISITNISIKIQKPVTFTFEKAINGNYSFENSKDTLSEINETIQIETMGDEEFTLKAFPDEGYSLYGWVFNNNVISQENPYTNTYGNDATIYPIFTISGRAVFKNNSNYFDDLNNAIDSAINSSDKIISQAKSGSLEPSGDYNIPSGITLYIPNDATVTIYTNNDVVQEHKVDPSEYMWLTLGENTTITAQTGSTIYIAGICSGNNTGAVSGGYGHIVLEKETSVINLQNGTNLYCYGYITGKGIVYAQYGSNVHEFFQMTSWRGGNATKDMLNNRQKVFVITQYYVQNIESKLRIYSGANVIIRTGMVAANKLGQANATFIGNDGIFRVESGYLERAYDYTRDRIVYTINGKAKISSINLDLSVLLVPLSIDSADYTLPITNNMTINVVNDSEITIDQDLCLLPGVILTIDETSILRFSENTSLFVYDNDNWYNQKFGGNQLDIKQLSYVASNKGVPNKRTSTASSPDAEIDLNGEIIVNDGAAIYTTLGTLDNGSYTGGANIHSSEGTGKITFVQGLGTNTVTYQATQSNTTISYVDIPIDTAYLKNGDGSYFIPSQYTGGVENKTIYYDSTLKKWTVTETQVEKYDISFKDSKSSSTFTMEYTVGESFTFPTKDEVNFSYKTYDIKYWQVGSDSYAPGQSIIMGNNGDMEAIAIWGGWIQDNGEYKYIDYDTGEYLTGLHKLESYNSSDKSLHIYLFDESGIYLSSYSGVYFNSIDNKTYYIINGQVSETKGLAKFSTLSSIENFEYIYVQSDNSLLTSGRYYIDTNLNSLLASGYYNFDSNGYIIREDTETTNSNGEVYIKGNFTYIDGIKVSYGLFIYDSYYYYSNTNCEIVRDTTFYVSKTNNLGISEGLYYFDGQGRMYDQNFKLIEVKQDETK